MAKRVGRPPIQSANGFRVQASPLGDSVTCNKTGDQVGRREGMGRAAVSAGLTRGGTPNAAQCRSALHPPAEAYESGRAPNSVRTWTEIREE